jgi:hypothetical protein
MTISLAARDPHVIDGLATGNSVCMGPIIKIVIAPVPGRPSTYTASVGDWLVCRATNMPFLDAARALISEGQHPESILVMRHEGSDADALRAPLGIAARLSVEENVHGPIFRRFRMASPSAVAPPSIAAKEAKRPQTTRPSLGRLEG